MRGTLTSETHAVPADAEAFFAFAEARGWGDGLPLIPPTPERVQAMLETRRRAARRRDRRGRAAPRRRHGREDRDQRRDGGLPAEVLSRPCVAAVRAVCEPRFNLYALNTTTCCATPALMINGPARAALGIECGYSCLGHNGRANATIGRALRLVMRNVGGSIPGRGEQVGLRPARTRLALLRRVGGEEPLGAVPRAPRLRARGERGHGALRDRHAGHRRHLGRDRRGADLGAGALDRLDRQQQGAGAAGGRRDAAPALPRLRPQDRARRARRSPTCSACCTSTRARRSSAGIATTGRSSRSAATWRTARVPLCAAPEQFLIAVAGGESGHHALNFCTFGLTWSVSVPFTLEPSATAAASSASCRNGREPRRLTPRDLCRCCAAGRGSYGERPRRGRRARRAELRRARPRRRRLGAARLRERRLRASAHVGLLAGNSPAWLAAAFGVWRAGATLVPISTFVTARELGEILAHADVETLIVQPRLRSHDYLALLAELPVDAPSAHATLDRRSTLAAPSRGDESDRRRPSSTPSRSRASSTPPGTTGRAKGVMLSHRAILATVAADRRTHRAHADDSLLSTPAALLGRRSGDPRPANAGGRLRPASCSRASRPRPCSPRCAATGRPLCICGRRRSARSSPTRSSSRQLLAARAQGRRPRRVVRAASRSAARCSSSPATA